MVHYLLDTNLLLRAQDPDSEHGLAAIRAIGLLTARAEVLCVTPQVIREFWSVATRSAEVNGLGWDVAAVSRQVDSILDQFVLLDDVPGVFDIWLDLVRTHKIMGKQVHDARLVALMKAHKVENLLTFNTEDFRPYQEIKPIHPGSVE